jgi:hypothetical protein
VNRRSRLALAACLLIVPPALLLAARSLGWVEASTTEQTFIGIAITAVGGLVVGIISERFLGRGRNSVEQTAGLIAATALSVTTIGILYLLCVRGPMSAIGTPERAVKQIFGFVEFLTAQGAGILLSTSRFHET